MTREPSTPPVGMIPFPNIICGADFYRRYQRLYGRHLTHEEALAELRAEPSATEIDQGRFRIQRKQRP